MMGENKLRKLEQKIKRIFGTETEKDWRNFRRSTRRIANLKYEKLLYLSKVTATILRNEPPIFRW